MFEMWCKMSQVTVALKFVLDVASLCQYPAVAASNNLSKTET